MPSSVDHEYLERRHRESLERAEQSADPSVARVHRGFAEVYSRALKVERGSPGGGQGPEQR